MNIIKKFVEAKYRYWFLAAILSFMTVLSFVLVMQSQFEDIPFDDMKEEIEAVGCVIIDYELECSLPYLELEGVTIDLSDEPILPTPDIVVLTKTSIKMVNYQMTYFELLTQLQHEEPVFDYDDAVEVIHTMVNALQTILVVVGMIFITIWIVVANHLYSLLNQALLKRSISEFLSYQKIYRVTMISWGAILLLNSITRILFKTSATSFIQYSLPGGWLGSILLQVIVIYFISKWILRSIDQNIDIENTEELF